MIYTHLGATPKGVLTENAIELLPNVGFSLQGVLDVLCTVWQPSGALKSLKQGLCWAKDNLMTAAGRRKLCELLVDKGRDILNGLAEAASQKMLQWADVAGIGSHCAICGSGGVDVKKLLEDIGMAVLGAIGSDGLSYGALAKNIGFGALAEAACCAVMQGVKAVRDKLPINRAFEGLKRQCVKLLAASGDAEVPGLSTAITFDFSGSMPSSGGSQVPPGSAGQVRVSTSVVAAAAAASGFVRMPGQSDWGSQGSFARRRAPPSTTDTTVKSGVSWPWPLILTAAFTGSASWWIWRRRGKR